MARYELMRDALGREKQRAERLHDFFAEHRILVLNIMGSPGSGKTTLIEKVIEKLKDDVTISVIEGDLATTVDSERIEKTGADVFQINTGGICHLSPEMVERAIDKMNIRDKSILMIENVGNLVCPASFDLGEDIRMVLVSTPEGDDKPEKYPVMFLGADIFVITKMDLIEMTDFNIDRAIKSVQKIKHNTEIFTFSRDSNEDAKRISTWLKEEYTKKIK